MQKLSLKERIEWLERELPPKSDRYRVHEDLPFAILVYEPTEEWELRKELRRLSARLENEGRTVVRVSLADLLWTAIEEHEGLDVLVSLEREQGFQAAQRQVTVYLSDSDFSPLPDALAARLSKLDPKAHVCFLTRAAAMGPDIYHLSALLEQMLGKTRVPTILFYPGHLVDEHSLRFMGLPDRDALGSYRVKIYA